MGGSFIFTQFIFTKYYHGRAARNHSVVFGELQFIIKDRGEVARNHSVVLGIYVSF